MPDLLIELFSEEIPARMQARAADDLRRLVTDGLVEAGLTYAGAAGFATPRRLALTLEGLSAESAPKREERRGPKLGAPDAAIEGFCRGAGVSRAALEVRDDKKGQVYFAVIDTPGRPAAAIIAEVLDRTIRNFPWPKSMRWGAGNLRWVRPLHSILCILSDEAGASVVPLTVEGITASDQTYGHRFHAPDPITVTSFDDYEAKLKRAHVILRADARAAQISNEAETQAFARGQEIVADPGLLAEVAGLVEWPVVLMGQIDDAFLGLPPEVLQTSMKEHQKFFSVKNPKTGRIEGFVTVANIETADQGATILAGNQKVLAARLADAKFFWENDLRVAQAGMGPWLDSLANVTFHNKLGSQKDRIARIAALARDIAPQVGADPDLAAKAAQVAKADLASEMVYEFPELQGLMGRYYAKAAGLPAEVAAACEAHYAPLGPSDDVPSAPVSVAVALADKIDTLTGFWAIDEKPTGSKDPFALRRAALGVIRLVLENDLTLPLNEVMGTGFLCRIEQSLIDKEQQSSAELNKAIDDKENAKKLVDDVLGEGWGSKSTPSQTILQAAAENRDYQDAKLRKRIDVAAKIFTGKTAHAMWYPLRDVTLPDLLSFFHDRLKVFLKDAGIRHDIIDACISPMPGAPRGAAPGNDDLTLLVKRARALAATLATDDGENLIQGFKRANNILSQAEAADGVEYSYGADLKFAEEPAEKALFAALDAAEAKITPAMASQDFGAAMTAMAALRGPIDQFFTDVQVNADSQVLRRNRLNLLSRIRAICLGVADLTKVEG